jgi:hypothetical protein
MGHGNVVKKILNSKHKGKRRMGRLRTRRLQDAEKDLREMKVKSSGQRKMDVCK